MVDAYTGEIRLVGWLNGGRAPANWAQCNGGLLSVTEYPALYSLIGTTYGGNGTTNFALPDLRGRLPMGQGTGTGLTPRTLGQMVGVETVTLTAANLPVHNHAMNVVNTTATATLPGTQAALGFGITTAPTVQYLKDIATAGATVSPVTTTIGMAGSPSPSPHDNIMPSVALAYYICLNGIYPTRS